MTTLAITPLASRAQRPVDIASLAVFRIGFGAVMCFAIVRLLTSGWIPTMYGNAFAFHYRGFGWVHAWPVWGMYLHYGVLAVLALMIAAGAWTRIVTPLFVLGFAYAQLCDVTNYLNHHYLAILLGGLLCVLPADRAWSVDAWREPARRATHVPAWVVWIVRFQVGVVYVFAGLAKAQADWLLHAQPLNIWLSARTDTPVIGPWLDERWVAFALSWAGFVFDTTIVLWLSWRRTRLVAFGALIAFHAATGWLFNIGMFPLIMTSAALIFFAPSWPRRVLRRPLVEDGAIARPGRVVQAILILHVIVQVALPLRHRVRSRDVLWDEDGMRFSWQVLVREKHGAVTFIVRFADGRRLEVPPRAYLSARQEREMAGQPDLILQLAHRIAADFGPGVAVFADSHVSLNGRPAVPLIDPRVDLAKIDDDGDRTWVMPPPTTDPIHLRAIR